MEPMTILIAVIGVITGWMVYYLSDTLPATRRLKAPLCLHCGRRLNWLDYTLGRDCRFCQRPPRRLRYLALLLSGGIGAVVVFLFPPERLGFVWAWALITYLAVVAIIDIEHRVILNEVSLVGAVLGLALGITLHGWQMTLIGGVAGFAIMYALYTLGEAFATWMARRRGQDLDEVALGFGDVNLCGVMGLILGWPGVVMGIIAAIFLGGAFSLLMILIQLIGRRYSPFMAIPYAPFIILGMMILLLR